VSLIDLCFGHDRYDLQHPSTSVVSYVRGKLKKLGLIETLWGFKAILGSFQEQEGFSGKLQKALEILKLFVSIKIDFHSFKADLMRRKLQNINRMTGQKIKHFLEKSGDQFEGGLVK
jgi:hypothetical protein